MPLEEEMLGAAPRSPGRVRASKPMDRFVRAIATLLLVFILTFVFWVPFYFLGPAGAAFVLAVVSVVIASLASRVYHLRIRVHALEAVLDDRDVPRQTGLAATRDASAVQVGKPLEEVEQKP